MNSRRLMASPAPRTTSGMQRISHFWIENVSFVTPKQTAAMSALGQKRTSEVVQSMSALPPKADIGTGPSFDAATPAAWRYSPRSAAQNYWGRCSAGLMGQVSGPEQNPIVTELAGPSQHLLPATSKTASGSSSLNTSSS